MSQSIPSHLLFKTDNFRNEDQKRNVMSFNPHQDPFCILTHHPSEITVTDQSQQSSLSSSSLDYAFPPPSITTNSMIQQARRNSASILLSTNSNFVSPQSNMIPFYHEQQRSMSVSYSKEEFPSYLFNNNNNNSGSNGNLHTIMQYQHEEEEKEKQHYRHPADLLLLPTRSSSSSIWNPSLKQDDNDWSFQQQCYDGGGGRRRASMLNTITTTSSNNNNMLTVDDEINEIKERMRRFSLAPPLSSNSHNNILESNSSLFMMNNNQRRHSLAGPAMFHNTAITTNIINNNDIISELSVKERLSDTTTNEKVVDNLGKGTRLDSDILNQETTLFYVVEFKGGRSDLFYCQRELNIKVNDLVIVEADRGHDLGKVTMEDITRQQLEQFYCQLKNSSNATSEEVTSTLVEKKKWFAANQIYIKKIFRLARPDEIVLLITKSQDEQKALVVCQTKIKQKKLSMQIVDAEYQWDRRKLTFYFIAEKRVDFRELVRELFKLYKTRIWMYSASFLKSSQFSA